MNTAPFSDCIIAGITLENYYLKDCDWEIVLAKGIQYGVSGLLANGFTIKEENFADHATIPENCFIDELATSEYGPDYKMTIPCNIKRGDTEESLLNVLKDFHYDTSESSSGEFVYYEIYDPNGKSSLNKFEITVHSWRGDTD